MIYKLEIQKDGVRGSWLVNAQSAVEAILNTMALGVDVVGWKLQ